MSMTGELECVDEVPAAPLGMIATEVLVCDCEADVLVDSGAGRDVSMLKAGGDGLAAVDKPTVDIFSLSYASIELEVTLVSLGEDILTVELVDISLLESVLETSP